MKKSTSRALSTSPIFSNSQVSYIGKEKHATLSDSLVLIEDREEGREVPCPSSFYLCYVGISNFQRDFLRVILGTGSLFTNGHYYICLFLIPSTFRHYLTFFMYLSSSLHPHHQIDLPHYLHHPPHLTKSTICPTQIQPPPPHDDHVCRCHGS